MMWCPHKISFSLQDPDAAQTESQPGTMVSITGRTFPIMHNSSCANRCVSQNSHTVRQLYATHLKRQIEPTRADPVQKEENAGHVSQNGDQKRDTEEVGPRNKKTGAGGELCLQWGALQCTLYADCNTINASIIVLLSSPSSKETSESNNKVIHSNKRSKNIVLSSLFHECTVGLP